ncbi:MAG: hypothetical protein LQ351_005284 [Letrouitia transgressa]|nr:MAG: hypothetical protein LQ351_005284 [Letrouitia transgressa]
MSSISIFSLLVQFAAHETRAVYWSSSMLPILALQLNAVDEVGSPELAPHTEPDKQNQKDTPTGQVSSITIWHRTTIFVSANVDLYNRTLHQCPSAIPFTITPRDLHASTTSSIVCHVDNPLGALLYSTSFGSSYCSRYFAIGRTTPVFPQEGYRKTLSSACRCFQSTPRHLQFSPFPASMACNEDNALRSLLRFSSLASMFCPSYLSGPTTPPLPDYVTAFPESQIFSACACFESRLANAVGPPPTHTATTSRSRGKTTEVSTLTRTLTHTIEHVAGGTSLSTKECSFLHCKDVPPQTPPSVVIESKSFSAEFRPPQACSGGPYCGGTAVTVASLITRTREPATTWATAMVTVTAASGSQIGAHAKGTGQMAGWLVAILVLMGLGVVALAVWAKNEERQDADS